MHHANSLHPSKHPTAEPPKPKDAQVDASPAILQTRNPYVIPPGRYAALFPNLMTARSESPGDFLFFTCSTRTGPLPPVVLDPHLALAPPTQAPEQKMPDSFLCSIASHAASVGADGSHFTGLYSVLGALQEFHSVKYVSISSSCQANDRTQFPRVSGSPRMPPPLPPSTGAADSVQDSDPCQSRLRSRRAGPPSAPPWVIANMQP